MLSAALRCGYVGTQPILMQPRLPPVLTQPQSLAKSREVASSFSDAESLGPIFESPRAQQVGIPAPSRHSVFEAEEEAPSASHGDEDCMFGEELELENDPHARAQPSAASSQSRNNFAFLNTPSVLGPLASGAGTPGLHSAGPSGDFTIGRAAMSMRSSMGDMQAELEHMSSCTGARGSRPIGIPRAPAATYSPSAGAFMPGFVPPHELAANSMQNSDPMVVHSHRHKSTAERLRTAVFEQTGVVSVATATSFLHQQQQQPIPSRRQQT
ncbi:hypothetical protein TSOC_011988 [Tetrabaena socialis]|uniref:Uncharacterized protein n=1 Tax=Tetrabaena socialis TaxID=47790 RepID=A0A2J7ZP70_9CHLO|nr:hypothetical protein TSOC_011988 [Tetrabaena socialis]|eukprot:PNH02058.1 hypothetical protein TSOC_011988 [Tetrabaena socialis]